MFSLTFFQNAHFLTYDFYHSVRRDLNLLYGLACNGPDFFLPFIFSPFNRSQNHASKINQQLRSNDSLSWHFGEEMVCLRGTLVADVFLRSGLKSYLPFPKIVAVGSLRRAIIIIIREETPFPALEKMFVLTRRFIFLSL